MGKIMFYVSVLFAIFPLISHQGNQYAFCNSIFKIKNKKEY